MVGFLPPLYLEKYLQTLGWSLFFHPFTCDGTLLRGNSFPWTSIRPQFSASCLICDFDDSIDLFASRQRIMESPSCCCAWMNSTISLMKSCRGLAGRPSVVSIAHCWAWAEEGPWLPSGIRYAAITVKRLPFLPMKVWLVNLPYLSWWYATVLVASWLTLNWKTPPLL